jgi:LmbE family N-acetylglucosaminyl deacetylase
VKTLIVGPHADDELLGCGGFMLRRKAQGAQLGWILMTSITVGDGWSVSQAERQSNAVDKVRDRLGIIPDNFFGLGFPAAKLDQLPMSSLVQAISKIIELFKPEELLLPHPGDVHSDHRVTFETALACAKWFRYPSINRVLTYQTLSETDFGMDPRYQPFQPNVYEDISDHIDAKLDLLNIYEYEMGAFPFPRSQEGILALAKVRGMESGFMAAEGFCLLRERRQ